MYLFIFIKCRFWPELSVKINNYIHVWFSRNSFLTIIMLETQTYVRAQGRACTYFFEIQKYLMEVLCFFVDGTEANNWILLLFFQCCSQLSEKASAAPIRAPSFHPEEEWREECFPLAQNLWSRIPLITSWRLYSMCTSALPSLSVCLYVHACLRPVGQMSSSGPPDDRQR